MSGACNERQSGASSCDCATEKGDCSFRTIESERGSSLWARDIASLSRAARGSHGAQDAYRIDSHKLIYHPERVNKWLNGEPIYPIYVEISPTSACNHRCVFCALDFVGYKPEYLDLYRMQDLLGEFEKLGIKSIMFGGEGEPFLHDDLDKMISSAAYHRIDTAITTNGVLFTNPHHYLPITNWIKVSINAGSGETYQKIHRAPQKDFHTVIQNMERAAEIRLKEDYPCTLGMQTILLNHNNHELFLLAEIARDIGMDYLVIKPYSHHLSTKHKDLSATIPFAEELAADLEAKNTDNFKVIFRTNTLKRMHERIYKECLALPFWAYISSVGDVWNCSAKMGNDDDFILGNIYENKFREIWSLAKSTNPEIDNCRLGCRMDACNEYLWKLKHPDGHVNFI